MSFLCSHLLIIVTFSVYSVLGFQTFLVLHALDGFEEHWVFPMSFSWLDWGYGFWGGRPQKRSALFTASHPGCHLCQHTSHTTNLDVHLPTHSLSGQHSPCTHAEINRALPATCAGKMVFSFCTWLKFSFQKAPFKIPPFMAPFLNYSISTALYTTRHCVTSYVILQHIYFYIPKLSS